MNQGYSVDAAADRPVHGCRFQQPRTGAIDVAASTG
jgi:hypothetical protein